MKDKSLISSKDYLHLHHDQFAKEIRAKFKVPISDELVQKGLNSLEHINEFVMVGYMRNQSHFCTRCGACCRNCTPLAFTKPELRRVAKKLGLSYKKLKSRLKARPLGRNQVMNVPGAPCPFLEGNNYCTIYELRPNVCRVYPMGKVIVDHASGLVSSLPEDCPAIRGMMVTQAASQIVREMLDEKFGEGTLEEMAKKMYPVETLEASKNLPVEERLRLFHKIQEDLGKSSLFKMKYEEVK